MWFVDRISLCCRNFLFIWQRFFFAIFKVQQWCHRRQIWWWRKTFYEHLDSLPRTRSERHRRSFRERRVYRIAPKWAINWSTASRPWSSEHLQKYEDVRGMTSLAAATARDQWGFKKKQSRTPYKKITDAWTYQGRLPWSLYKPVSISPATSAASAPSAVTSILEADTSGMWVCCDMPPTISDGNKVQNIACQAGRQV